jgi:ribosome-associated toxin RatA of RatAB toxin-antitoxin module
MEMSTREMMRADPDVIFRLAADVEAWPDILPHYRRVRVLRERGPRRLVEMAAHRDGFPVRWLAIQELHPGERRITFRHVQGITRGMEVAWTLTPTDEGVQVEIWHAFSPPWPLIPDALIHVVIGELFVENIAGKTLRCIREIAEAQARAATGRDSPVLAAGVR